MKQSRPVIQNFKERVGRNIKMLRNNSGVTGEEFAEKLGISRSHLHRLENAKAYGFSFEGLYNMGKEFTDLDRLFREDIEAMIAARNKELIFNRQEEKSWKE